MNNTLLSIVIPTYNRKKNLQMTLSLLAEQSLDDVEIIILDNASDYELTDLIEFYKTRSEFKFLRNDFNVGLYANLFRAIEQAAGSFVWTLGDDDLPSPSSIADIRNTINAIRGEVPPVAIKFSSHLFLHCNETITSLATLHRHMTDWRYFSSLLFLSNLVVYRNQYMSLIRFGYNNTLSNYGHLVPIFTALESGASVITSSHKLVTGSQDTNASWAPGVVYMTMLVGSRLIQSNINLNVADVIQNIITRHNSAVYLTALLLRIHFTLQGENRKNYLRLFKGISLKAKMLWLFYFVLSPFLTPKNLPTLVDKLKLGDVGRI